MEQLDWSLMNWLLCIVVGGVLLYIAGAVLVSVCSVVAFWFAARAARKANPNLFTREQIHQERLEKIRWDIRRGCRRTDGPIVLPDGE